jgi:hypothetical protein
MTKINSNRPVGVENLVTTSSGPFNLIGGRMNLHGHIGCVEEPQYVG